MSRFPSLPLFTDAWVAATKHLTRLERGTYHDLLVLMWRTPECRVPNDDDWLAKRLGMTLEEISTELRPLVDEFCLCDGNFIVQKRLLKEYIFVTRQSRQRSVSAKSRWAKEKTPYGKSTHPHMQNDAPTPTPTIDTPTSSFFEEPREAPPMDTVDNSPPADADQPQAVTEEASKRAFVWTPYVPKEQRPPVAAPTTPMELAAKYGRPEASPQFKALLAAKRFR